MGIFDSIFGTNPKAKIAKELSDVDEIINTDKYNAAQLTKIKEWLISINTRLNNGSLTITTENMEKIKKIKDILRKIENEEHKTSDGVQHIQNLMFQLK